MSRAGLVLHFAIISAACGGSQGGMSGPSMTSSYQGEDGTQGIQSDDILGRDVVAEDVEVKHILIGWRDLGANGPGEQDPRAAKRTRQEADALAQKLLGRVRAGEAIEPLMAEFSEDPGSAQSGDSYEITPDAQYVFEFKRLGMRLHPGEAGLVMSTFGWHIMKRVK